jgi:pyrroline-5-carboxylate reductase
MQITVIGSGNMGSALSRHLIKNHAVVISNRSQEKGKALAKEIGATFKQDAKEAIKGADWIVVAVKPKDLESVALSISKDLLPNQRIISVLAGLSLTSLSLYFPNNPIFRVMPNLAISVGKGILGICAEDKNLGWKEEVDSIFSSLGLLLWIPESKMEAFASLAASSPAFIFILIEAMIESGIEMGFSPAEGREIVLKVLEGSVAMLRNGGSLQDLKWQITSPGGTTIAGIKELEKGLFRSTIWSALAASHHKGVDISKKN